MRLGKVAAVRVRTVIVDPKLNPVNASEINPLTTNPTIPANKIARRIDKDRVKLKEGAKERAFA
jgi:hypothetical protein